MVEHTAKAVRDDVTMTIAFDEGPACFVAEPVSEGGGDKFVRHPVIMVVRPQTGNRSRARLLI